MSQVLSLSSHAPGHVAAAVPSPLTRLAATVAFVGAWMALGLLFHLGANAYLVLGVPLTVAFQLVVARRPIKAAWVREAPPIRLEAVSAVAFLFVAALPAQTLVQRVCDHDPSGALWALAAIAGAFGLVYTARQPASRNGRALRLAVVAALPGLVIMTAATLAQHAPLGNLGERAVTFVRSFALYVPVCFALEEVVFRGVLDPWLARSEDGAGFRRASVVLLSALWGVWHLPIVPAGGVAVAVGLAVVHVLYGIGLTVASRRTGTLMAAALAHALIDAFRNAWM